jgi:hypothetical protein
MTTSASPFLPVPNPWHPNGPRIWTMPPPPAPAPAGAGGGADAQ